MGGRIKASKVTTKELIVETSMTIGGATVSADGAELNLLDGSVAGTSVASKALVLGANKNTDVLALPVSGLKIGAGAGTAVDATAAELNLIHDSVAGTAVASKALSLGADKNVDTLAIADGGLKLGAGAGTAVNATAAEINAAADQTVMGADGIHPILCAMATFDPSATPAMRTQGAHGLGVTIPIQAVVLGGFYEVNTACASANNTSTIALNIEGANDIFTATAVSDAKLSTTGRKAITPKFNTPETTAIKCTAAREITATVAVQDLTAGKITVVLFYVVGKACA